MCLQTTLRKLVYLSIKQMADIANDVIIVTSSLTKDMTGKVSNCSRRSEFCDERKWLLDKLYMVHPTALSRHKIHFNGSLQQLLVCL